MSCLALLILAFIFRGAIFALLSFAVSALLFLVQLGVTGFVIVFVIGIILYAMFGG